MAKFVRYGPSPRYGMPEAGFCASSFVLVRDDRGRVLAGIARDHRNWRQRWQPNINVYRPVDQEAEFTSWRLPAAYLVEGEHPDEAARRVLTDQIGLPAKRLERPRIYSFYDKSSWYPGRRHYDLCFVYDLHAPAPKAVPVWWQRLEFVTPRFLRGQELGSAMSDLVRVLGPNGRSR